MPNEFKVKNGLIVDLGGANITGSVIATGGFTGSLLGTASNAVSSSFASTSSFVNTLRQNVILSGSLLVSGSILGSGSSYNTTIDLISSAVSTNGTGSITFGTKYLIDNNNARSVRWNERYLTDSNQSISVDWNSRTLTSGSTNVLNWSSGTGSLIGTSSWAVSASQAVSASRAVTSSFAISASWAPGGAAFPYIGTAVITGSLIVSGANGGINTSLGFPVLFQNDGVNTIVFGNGKLWLNDSLGGTSVDWGNRYLLDSAGTTKTDWEQNYLVDGAAITRVDWGNGVLNDSAGTMALDWESRRTHDASGTRSSDFNTRYLIYPDGTSTALNYGTQGQVTLNADTIITGSLAIGTSSLGTTENTLVVGLPSAASPGGSEGGQILLQAPGGTYTTASMIDNYQNKLRFLRGTNASSDAYKMQIDMHSGQVQMPNYNSKTAFTGSVVATLGADSNGTLITISPILSIQDVTDGTAVTGTTSNTLTKSILIPANTVGVGDVLYIKSRARKTGTAGTLVVRMYVNTSAAIGGSLIATSATNAASTVYFQYNRTAAVKSTTNTETMAGNGNINADDNVAFSSAVSANNIDWTVNQYLVIAHANSSAADSSVNSFGHIQINKA